MVIYECITFCLKSCPPQSPFAGVGWYQLSGEAKLDDVVGERAEILFVWLVMVVNDIHRILMLFIVEQCTYVGT